MIISDAPLKGTILQLRATPEPSAGPADAGEGTASASEANQFSPRAAAGPNSGDGAPAEKGEGSNGNQSDSGSEDSGESDDDGSDDSDSASGSGDSSSSESGSSGDESSDNGGEDGEDEGDSIDATDARDDDDAADDNDDLEDDDDDDIADLEDAAVSDMAVEHMRLLLDSLSPEQRERYEVRREKALLYVQSPRHQLISPPWPRRLRGRPASNPATSRGTWHRSASPKLAKTCLSLWEA